VLNNEVYAVQSTYLRTLHSNRELLKAWTIRTVRARYQQSFLGVLWTIAQPVAQVAIFTIIFTLVIPIDTGNIPYPIFNFAAIAPWLLFSMALTDMVSSLVINMNLVTKIYFPREILPLSMLLARILDFVIGLGILVLLILYFQMSIDWEYWLLLPLVLLVQAMLTIGLGLFGAALNVFYRDIQHVFALVLRIWLYASPIIYPVERIAEQYRALYFLNPMAGILEAYRAVLLRGEMPDSTLLTAAIISAIVFVFGYWFFKRVEFQFADVV
jgi:lipopolysaccharide transport system permease protein